MAKLVGPFSYIVGIALILGGLVTWVMVGSMLSDQRITIPDDGCLAGRTVSGPLTAYCQALIINEHTLASTDGKTYAELDRDDPLRTVAMNGSFLQASLYTSVVAFGLAAMAVLIGVLFVLLGGAVNNFSQRILAIEGGSGGA